ncbi:MAG: YcxB family protein [Anaerovoracaceae bacterium]
MDLKFENKYITTLETTRAYCKHASHTCKIYKMEGYVLGLVFLIMLVTGIIYKMGLNYVVVPAIGVLAGIFLVNCEKWQGKRVYDKRVKIYGEKFPYTCYEFGDRVTLKEGDIEARYDYVLLLDLRESRDYFFLMLDKENGLTIKKDSFTIGTADDFRDFITEKINKSREGMGMKPLEK